MRIISGKFKGRILKSFKAPHIRPTTDRVKETIFNVLTGYVDGASVLDLFAGTGNLSIEAISRGATQVVSVENHKKSIQIIKSNMQHFKISNEEIKIVSKDVLSFLKKAPEQVFNVILIDPPFTEKMAHEVMEALVNTSIFDDNSLIMIESSSQERIDDSYGPLKLQSRKNFGDKWVSFFSL
ncbi:MAG: 16S rRNA (guanine(966)-N(2))-methyltransferase RsmD [Bdellovibrionaceae bacterium]|nr:16S rRNA (guanine(966)-N(2))-methyltransferase RsmD [Pseudobdellovibrionaceae bacterium]